MLKTETMPLMIAWKMAPMALTMLVRQAPMVWKTDLNCTRHPRLAFVTDSNRTTASEW